MKLLVAALLIATAASAQQPAAKPGSVTCKVEPSAKSAADQAFAADRFAEAETLYTAQIAASPSVAASAGLVESQIEQNKLPESLASAKAAVAAFPASGEALALVGEAQLRAGNIDDASAAFTAARKMDFCSARTHFGFARIEQLSALNASARRELAIAHQLALGDVRFSEAFFATLPPALHAEGLRHLLASANDISAAHRQRLDEQATLLEKGDTCQRVSEAPIVKIPLLALYYSGDTIRDFSIPTKFAGKDPVDLELDSTASGIVLSQSDAKRLDVTPITGSGTPPFMGSAAKLNVGGVQYLNCPVTVLPDAALAGRYSLIGTDFFRDSLIHIDWNAKLITLSPYPGPATTAPVDASALPAEKNWSRVLVDSQRILLPTLVNKKPVGFFLLDTSYVRTTISPAAAAFLSPSSDSTVDIVGVDGPIVRFFLKEGAANPDESDFVNQKGAFVKVLFPQRTPVYRFAGNEQRDLSTLVFDLTPSSHAAGIQVGGIFGYPLLQRYFIDIDYRNGRALLNYDLMHQFREEELHPGNH